MKKGLLIGLIVVIGMISLTQIVLADQCEDTIAYNYTKCLDFFNATPPTDHYWGALNACSCCVINSSGDLSTLCPSSENRNISNCNRPIGVAIQRKNSGITIKGDTTHPVVYDPTCENCCNVGILVNNPLEEKWQQADVRFENITVKGWANGILLWRLGPGISGKIVNSTISKNGNGIYLLSSQWNNISSNYIFANNRSGIFLDSIGYGGIIKTMHNTIRNNWINNTNNTGFSDGGGINYWSVLGSGPNILGGINTGGNYWARPEGGGWSDSPSCQCNATTGFCDVPYQMDAQNIDYLPLCKPKYLKLNASATYTDWILDIDTNPNTLDSAIKIGINTTEDKWQITVYETLDLEKGHLGHMVEYHISDGSYLTNYLKNPLQIQDATTTPSTYKNLSEGGTPLPIIKGSGPVNQYFYHGLQQEIDDSDVAVAGDYVYRITLTFVATPGWE